MFTIYVAYVVVTNIITLSLSYDVFFMVMIMYATMCDYMDM